MNRDPRFPGGWWILPAAVIGLSMWMVASAPWWSP